MSLPQGERGKQSACSLVIFTLVFCSLCGANGAGEPESETGKARTDSSAIEFFEKSVRPILVERCQGCHGPSKQKSGLRLDSRQAALAGGLTGPAVVPGLPEKSLLIDAVNYGELYQMPPKSKLSAGDIAILTRWVKQGAAWGIDTSRPSRPGATATAKSVTPPALDTPGEFQRRAQWWCFQPITNPQPPAVSEDLESWPRNPIDRFILAAMERRGLSPAPAADRRTLIRRLTFDLWGLPPEPAQVAAFVGDRSPDAYERLVDRLLASPRYGERWARHWLDLVRFAETAGHEYDYEIPNAFRYRDYVIRALNADVPYHQFVIEQVAGDLLSSPRRHPTDGFNESIIGTGFFFLGEGTHSPVDLQEEADAPDRQPDRRLLQDVPGPDRGLCAVSRSQVRPDHLKRLLRSGRLPAQLSPSAGVHRSARAGFGPGSRLMSLKQTIREVLLEARPHLPSR